MTLSSSKFDIITLSSHVVVELVFVDDLVTVPLMFGVYIFLYRVYKFINIIKFYIDKVDAVVVDFLDKGCVNENGDGCWLGRKQPSTFDDSFSIERCWLTNRFCHWLSSWRRKWLR